MCIDVEGSSTFSSTQHMYKVGLVDLESGTIYSGPYTTVPLTRGVWEEAKIIPYAEGPNGAGAVRLTSDDPIGFHVFETAKAAGAYAGTATWAAGEKFFVTILRVSVKGDHSWGPISENSTGAGIRCQVVQHMRLGWR